MCRCDGVCVFVCVCVCVHRWKQAMQNCQLKLFQGDSVEGTLQRKRSVYGTHNVIGNYEELIKVYTCREGPPPY